MQYTVVFGERNETTKQQAKNAKNSPKHGRALDFGFGVDERQNERKGQTVGAMAMVGASAMSSIASRKQRTRLI
jgi:hypothetical protein